MSIGESVFDAMQRAVRPAAEALAPKRSKLGRGVAARRDATARLARWANASRDPRVPLLWVHAPSVGEALMAQAIVGALRSELPTCQIAFTHFSPSAERVATAVGADIADYLPWDTGREMRAALDALGPAAIAFVRTEIWPVLTREASRRGIRLALVNAVLAAGSSRTGRIARGLLAPAYRRLDAIGAVSTADATRFGVFGVDPDRVDVTGDARFDQVHARVRRLDRDSALLRRLDAPSAVTLVAGSTWPRDESFLVPAFRAIHLDGAVRLIIAPHEPTPEHLAALEARLDGAALTHARLSRIESGDSDAPAAVVVDRIGVLADLYVLADIAYVGGGFGTAGLHSVVEPAALEKPVVFGPRHGNAREAADLAGEGGGFVVRDGAELLARLSRLAARIEDRLAAGEAARRFVDARLGGAAGNAAMIRSLLA